MLDRSSLYHIRPSTPGDVTGGARDRSVAVGVVALKGRARPEVVIQTRPSRGQARRPLDDLEDLPTEDQGSPPRGDGRKGQGPRVEYRFVAGPSDEPVVHDPRPLPADDPQGGRGRALTPPSLHRGETQARSKGGDVSGQSRARPMPASRIAFRLTPGRTRPGWNRSPTRRVKSPKAKRARPGSDGPAAQTTRASAFTTTTDADQEPAITVSRRSTADGRVLAQEPVSDRRPRGPRPSRRPSRSPTRRSRSTRSPRSSTASGRGTTSALARVGIVFRFNDGEETDPPRQAPSPRPRPARSRGRRPWPEETLLLEKLAASPDRQRDLLRLRRGQLPRRRPTANRDRPPLH